MKRQSRSLNLEAGSVERYQVNGKLPYNFITLLIERYKNREIEPVHKPLVNIHRHGLKASEEERLKKFYEVNKMFKMNFFFLVFKIFSPMKHLYLCINRFYSI